jgi:hypothetical protein
MLKKNGKDEPVSKSVKQFPLTYFRKDASGIYNKKMSKANFSRRDHEETEK